VGVEDEFERLMTVVFETPLVVENSAMEEFAALSVALGVGYAVDEALATATDPYDW